VHMLAIPSKDLQLQPRSVKKGRRKTSIHKRKKYLPSAIARVALTLNAWIRLTNIHTVSHKKKLVQNQRQTYAQ